MMTLLLLLLILLSLLLLMFHVDSPSSATADVVICAIVDAVICATADASHLLLMMPVSLLFPL